MSQVIIIYAVIIVVVGFIALQMYFLQEEKENARLIETKFAPQLGLQYLGDLDFFELEKRKLGNLLQRRFQNSGKAQNSLAGSSQGVNIIFFTYRYSLSHRKNHFIQHPVLLIPTTSFNSLPLFFIRPPEILDGFKETIGYQFTKIPAAPSLVVQIAAEETEITSTLAHIPPHIWQLIETNQWYLLHDGQHFMMYAYNRPLPVDLQSYQHFIETGLDIFVHFLPEPTQLKFAA